MKVRYIILIVASFILITSSCKSENKNNNSVDRPNIILIMSDDMGFSDIGCYGGEINTPNLDKLASGGVRFLQFYNSARCCPTRASLMTGLYPHQTGIGHMTNPSEDYTGHDCGLPGYRGDLNKNSVTIAEVMKSAGYSTFMTGKWHLGMEHKDQWPLQRGFDHYYGILDGACNYFQPTYPRGITLDNDTITINKPDYYTTDAFTDNAIHFIDDAIKNQSQNPFFLYLAYNAPHWPLNAPKEDIEKYKHTYDCGWNKIRERRYEKMKEIGIISQDWKLSPKDFSDWDSLSEEKKKEMSLRMSIYAAQVDRMDQNIGKLISYLESEQILDNTVIVFIDDNGACAEGGEFGEGPTKILETKKGYFLTYGGGWANASNTPLREYKHWVHEGGISSPCIVHWPKGIPVENKGKFMPQYGFLPDIMATFVDLANADYPTEFNGNKIHPMQGESMVPAITGSNSPIHSSPIFWEHEGNKAVRLGQYKLVMKWKNVESNKWELYDIEKDRTELNDLSEEIPEKVTEMSAMWEEWAKTHFVEPWDKIQDIMKNKH